MATGLKNIFNKLIRSKVALALPITFLILLVSTLGIISVTYYLSVERINLQGQSLKVSTAKQSFVSLDDTILSTLWQPGSSATFDLTDSGGSINLQPAANILTVNVNDSISIADTLFNASIGKISYELPNSDSPKTGSYLKGDSQTITNQSGASLSQLCIANGDQGQPEIQLRYRPLVTYTTAGVENDTTVNNIRIYIVSLNSSDTMAFGGDIPLLISCTSTQLTTNTYHVSYQLQNLTITSQLDGATGSVSIPISSIPQGATINIETVISNVSVQRWIR